MFQISQELSKRLQMFLITQKPALATVNASAAMWCPNTCQSNCVGSCKGTCRKGCAVTAK